MKNNSSTVHGPCILDSGLKPHLKTNLFNNPSSSRSHKSRSKSEDVAFVAPLNLGTEMNSVISQGSSLRQMVVKKNSSEAVTCIGNTCTAKNEAIKRNVLLVYQKQLEGRCAKRKKAEDDHAVSSEKTSLSKENSVPFRSNVQHINGEHTGDKPLDLSDRFSGARGQEKKQGTEETCKNRLKQVTLHDIFSQIGKTIPEGSSSVQNANESCLFGRDLQEESYVQDVMLGKTFPDRKNQIPMKEEVPPFKFVLLPSSAQTEELLDDVKVCFSLFLLLWSILFKFWEIVKLQYVVRLPVAMYQIERKQGQDMESLNQHLYFSQTLVDYQKVKHSKMSKVTWWKCSFYCLPTSAACRLIE